MLLGGLHLGLVSASGYKPPCERLPVTSQQVEVSALPTVHSKNVRHNGGSYCRWGGI